MRDEQINYFVGGEASIAHAGQDGVNGVAGLGDEEIWRGQRDVEASSMEGNASTASAVANTDGTSELDADGNACKHPEAVQSQEARTSHRKTLCA